MDGGSAALVTAGPLLTKRLLGCPNSSQPLPEVTESQSRSSVGSEGTLQPQALRCAAAPQLGLPMASGASRDGAFTVSRGNQAGCKLIEVRKHNLTKFLGGGYGKTKSYPKLNISGHINYITY